MPALVESQIQAFHVRSPAFELGEAFDFHKHGNFGEPLPVCLPCGVLLLALFNEACYLCQVLQRLASEANMRQQVEDRAIEKLKPSQIKVVHKI